MTVLLLTVALFIHQGGETAAFNNITNTTTNTTTSTSNRRGMPSPWCYWLPFEPYEREVATYWEAESICRHNGLHLTSVHSAEENNFVLSLLWHGRETTGWLGLRVGVGGREVGREEGVRWLDGTPITFINWPRRGRLASGCVYMSSRGHWYTGHCDQRRRYLCKMSNSDYTKIRRQTRGAGTFYYHHHYHYHPPNSSSSSSSSYTHNVNPLTNTMKTTRNKHLDGGGGETDQPTLT
ncbi:hypothetical protein Pcinc_041157 [Petrolisthes cinctipes]|uniref:C-type lectin domain-containing protein n=1 Tax=Petrolisthes cinctipes TaxID=88211 RepID=A0AAE1BNU9_PETCI|nr:hypothetical protein Pcinc_041157 [Petrolisthes cinctipes]